jgi:hypothetical protein
MNYLKELIAKAPSSADRSPSDGESKQRSWSRYVSTVLRTVLFGYNPNAPFPPLKGKGRMGLVGYCRATHALSDTWPGAFMVAFFIVFVGRHWFPREFTGVAQLVVSAHKAVMVEFHKAGAIEVRKGLYVSFESELSQAKTDRVIATIRKEDQKVAEIFPLEVPEPIFIKVTLQSKPGREAGTEQRGAYHVDGHKAWGMHSIEASLIGVLNEHVVAHELTHMYAHLINPAINLLMDEGLAHYVQDTFDEPDSIDRGRLRRVGMLPLGTGSPQVRGRAQIPWPLGPLGSWLFVTSTEKRMSLSRISRFCWSANFRRSTSSIPT